MRHTLWSLALAGLGFGSLAMVGGTAIGGDVGPLAVGYGLLVVVAALYMVAGLAIRERVWQRFTRAARQMPTVDRLAGRRVF
jgi:Flp pilus assembly pilin Flp